MNKLATVFMMLGILLFSVVTSGADTLVFSDDFSTGFGTTWIVGTNTAVNNAPEVNVQSERVVWTQGYDYIESTGAITGSFRIEIDLERTYGSNACNDFVIELVDATGVAGALRLQYGSINKDTINLGNAPATNSSGSGYRGVCVTDQTGYLAEMDTVSPHKGTAAIIYKDDKVQFTFKNHNGQTIETPQKQAGALEPQKIRIWAVGNHRFVDAVRVYTLDDTDNPLPDIQVNGSNGPITVSSSEAVSLSLSLNAGGLVGQNADLWVATYNASTADWQSLLLVPSIDWINGIVRTYVTPLFDIPTFNFPTPTLPEGKNFVYFAVDNNADGQADATWYDAVEINIQSDTGDESDPGEGTCSNSDLTLSIDGETQTLSLTAYAGFEPGYDGLFSCAWHNIADSQLSITGLAANTSNGSTFTMSNTDPSHMNLIWESNMYIVESFNLTIDTWTGDGGVASGTFSATFYNGLLNQTIELSNVYFCAPIAN